MTVVPAQIRAARALLGWPQKRLAFAANLSMSRIHLFESCTSPLQPEQVECMRQALEGAGVVFLPSGADCGPGVKLAMGPTT